MFVIIEGINAISNVRFARIIGTAPEGITAINRSECEPVHPISPVPACARAIDQAIIHVTPNVGGVEMAMAVADVARSVGLGFKEVLYGAPLLALPSV